MGTLSREVNGGAGNHTHNKTARVKSKKSKVGDDGGEDNMTKKVEAIWDLARSMAK
jgi:hypothetical protein